jgi:hypothetical protein
VHTTQGARYTAIADSSGFYSLRYLPIGEYDVRAYDDQNGNRRRDFLEPVDSGHAASFTEPTDTVALIFNVLSADTTAPRIVSARSPDSLHVRIELDDYFDPVDALAAISAEVHLLPDSARYAGSTRVVSEPVFTAEQRAIADSAAAAAAAADTSGAIADTTVVADPTGRVPRPVVEAPPADTAALLPMREFVVRLDRALVPGSYTITVSGVVNLHGLAGGGTVRFDVSAPEPPPETPPQTPQPVPPDTIRRVGSQ